MKNKKNIIIVELAGSHDECIYSQALIYTSLGRSVHLIVSDNMVDRFENYKMLSSLNYFSIPHKRSQYFPQLFKIKKLINELKPELIIFNTCANNVILELLFLLGKRYNYAGIIHGIKKLTESSTQKLINLFVKKYFVLNDYLLDKLPPKINKSNFSSLYTIFNPVLNEKKSNSDSLRICIPGNFEYRRRDYKFLIDLGTNPELNEKVTFVILGNASHRYSNSKEFIEICNSLKIINKFEFFHNFLNPLEFTRELSKCDLLMPLLHPNVPNYMQYHTNQISGTFNLSFNHKIPMLTNSEFRVFDDISLCSFIYNLNNIISVINNLANNKDIIQNKRKEIIAYEKFSFSSQTEKVRRFLNLD